MSQSRTLSHLNQSLSNAVDLFVMTKFDQCFSVCNDVIKTAKVEPEQERNYEVIEAATALGIQALAETDMWHEVIAFITDVYGTIDLCPPRIIQVCILLHAHVKEYLPCHRLVQTWLKSPYNLSHKQCAQVIRVYAHHILCPTGSYGALKEIVNSCKSLTDSEREMLLRLPQTKRYAEAKQISPETQVSDASPDIGDYPFNKDPAGPFSDDASVDKSSDATHIQNMKKSKDEVPSTSLSSRLYKGCAIVWRYLQSQRFSLFIMAVLALWGLVQTQSGDPVSSLGRFIVLWKGFLHRVGLLTSSK